MRLYNEGIKTKDCCINLETSKFSISAEQGVDWMSLVNSACSHSIYSALTHASNLSETQGCGSFFCFFLSAYTHNMSSEGLVFFHLLLKHESLSTGDSAVCGQ